MRLFLASVFLVLAPAVACGGKTTSTWSGFPDDVVPGAPTSTGGCFCPGSPPPSWDAGADASALDLDASDVDADAGDAALDGD